MTLRISFIEPQEIEVILPLLMQLNRETPEEILKARLQEMVRQNYRCLGVFDGDRLVGICGLWFMTRHYCGRSIEPDHVMIDPGYQDRGAGRQLFDWIFNYARQNGFEATELNSYVNNTRSHKFYYNLGYEIKGFHFVRLINGVEPAAD